MNWIKQNKFISIFLLIFIILFFITGYFLYDSILSYNKTKKKYKRERLRLKRLESAPVYPNEKNLTKRGEDLIRYNKSANELERMILNKFGYDYSIISDTELHKKLKNRSSEIKLLASRAGVKLNPGFFMGMERYRDKLPNSAASPRLDFQLDAIYFVMKVIVESGVDSAYVNRKLFKGETDDKNLEEDSYVEKFIFDLKLVSAQSALNNIINSLSNSDKFFFLIRLLKIENEVKDGPLKLSGNRGGNKDYEDSFDLESNDNMVIAIGKEKLHSVLRVELIRFNPPKKNISNSHEESSSE